MATFVFKIVTPERVVYESEVSQATVPTKQGEITILPHHIPLVGALEPGEIVVIDALGVENSLAVSGGFVQVQGQSVIILADTAEMAHELDESRAEDAHKRAKQILETKSGARDHDYASLKVLMDKEMARLRVARKYKRKK